MKYTSVILLSLIVCASSCNDSCRNHNDRKEITCRPTRKCPPHLHDQADSSSFVSIDSANKMVSSYLASINYPQDDTDVYSLILNADSLRAYLSDTRIKNIKIMMAQTLSYINNVGYGQYAGYQCGALTNVIVGYDSLGNYVYYISPGRPPMVMDHMCACPNICPERGTAQSNLFVPYNNKSR
jgi:hypothetical protein